MSDLIRSDLKGYGLVFKNLTCNEHIDIEAKGLYAYLSSYAGATDVAFPGVELICHHLNISERRFNKYKKQLVENGFLTITRNRTANGFSNNIYHLHHKPVSYQNVSIQNVSLQNVSLQNDRTKNNSLKNNSLKNNSDKNICASDDDAIVSEFDEWYNLYDKKKDRKAAFIKYKAVRKKHSKEVIMKGTKDYLKTITDKQYQKYPKTFLNNESFLDDYSEEVKGSSNFSIKSFLGDIEE